MFTADSPPAPAPLAAALDRLDRDLDGAAGVDLDQVDDRELLDAVLETERQANRLAALQLRLLGAGARRDAHRVDGAATMASWLRNRARLDHADATRRVQAAVRLPSFPALQANLDSGAIGLAAVNAVTRAAVPDRIAALADHDTTLAYLALAAPPWHVGVAVRRIADHVDPDGTRHAAEPNPGDGCGPDPRRELSVRARYDGLGELHGWLDQFDAELLLGLLDALDEPDPPDTPFDRRRSPAQRRADTFGKILRLAAAARSDGLAPGASAHLLLRCDLADLLHLDRGDPRLEQVADLLASADPAGLSDLLTDLLAEAAPPGDAEPAQPVEPTGDAGPADNAEAAGNAAPAGDARPAAAPRPVGRRTQAWEPRLRWTGPISRQRAVHLALAAKLTVVLTCGPWRVVNVGRTMRTLPPWLRMVLDAIHGHCRGPDCDRPAAWTESHHVTPWSGAGGETDLNDTIPVCQAHHGMLSDGTWVATYDPDTGDCTWTAADGTRRTTAA